MKHYLRNYVDQQKAALESIPLNEVENLISKFKQVLLEDRQIFVFGNGGSGSNASHFITDLGKTASDSTYRPFRCLSLNENISWITAIGNDYTYEDIFVRQLVNYARPGDVAMALSVSGDSPNLIKTFEWCRLNNIYTIALAGGKKVNLLNYRIIAL